DGRAVVHCDGRRGGRCVFSRCLKDTASSCGSRAVATVPGSIISKLGCGKPGCCADAGMLKAHSATPNAQLKTCLAISYSLRRSKTRPELESDGNTSATD